MKHMGIILKAARERQGLGLRAMAKKSGIAAATLWRLEANSISNPTYLTMQTVSDAYGISPALWFAKIITKAYDQRTGEYLGTLDVR
jgi:transcriptional regulator with XRE-family HTH domain